ncbi:MAG: hypothetical protein GX455_08360, partial [Phycisphaerae bacterium]|nr:hypothetical protein [Phycisphaerae bacterium]
MRTIMVMVATMVLAPTAAGFVGEWVNIESNTGGIVRIEIERSGLELAVHAWGDCDPPCDWGTQFVKIPHGNTVEVEYDFGFKRVAVAITKIGINSLRAQAFHDYVPSDPRSDYWTDDYFQLEGSGKPLPDLVVSELTIPAPVVVQGA